MWFFLLLSFYDRVMPAWGQTESESKEPKTHLFSLVSLQARGFNNDESMSLSSVIDKLTEWPFGVVAFISQTYSYVKGHRVKIPPILLTEVLQGDTKCLPLLFHCGHALLCDGAGYRVPSECG